MNYIFKRRLMKEKGKIITLLLGFKITLKGMWLKMLNNEIIWFFRLHCEIHNLRFKVRCEWFGQLSRDSSELRPAPSHDEPWGTHMWGTLKMLSAKFSPTGTTFAQERLWTELGKGQSLFKQKCACTHLFLANLSFFWSLLMNYIRPYGWHGGFNSDKTWSPSVQSSQSNVRDISFIHLKNMSPTVYQVLRI